MKLEMMPPTAAMDEIRVEVRVLPDWVATVTFSLGSSSILNTNRASPGNALRRVCVWVCVRVPNFSEVLLCMYDSRSNLCLWNLKFRIFVSATWET